MNKLWLFLIFVASFGLVNGQINSAQYIKPSIQISDLQKVKNVSLETVQYKYASYFKSAHELTASHAIESPTGFHITYQHHLFGKEVLNSDLILHYSKSGELFFEQNKLKPAGNHTYYDFIPLNSLFVWTEDEYRMAFKETGGSATHPTYIISLDGEVIEEEYQKLYFHGPDSLVHAKVFLVNPINSAGVDYGGAYIDNKDSNSTVLEAELKEVTMRVNFSNDTFFLGNSRFIFKNVIDPNTPPVFSLNDTFFFNRNDVEFEDVNAFYHLSSYADYVESSGYSSLLHDRLVVDGNAGTSDFSAFDPNPSPKTLEFGLGGVDDAEDAEVVIHEMIHSLSNKAAPLTVKGNDRQAMEEGNCDYLATTYSKRFSTHNDWKVFSWDGHNEFWAGFVNNSTKNYKTDRTGFRDQDREIWSSALMCIEDKLGPAKTDSLIFEHFFYQAKNMTMPDMALVLLKIDTLQNNGANIWDIRKCFVDRGILEPLGFENVELKKGIIVKNSKAFASGLAPVEIEFAEASNRTIRLISLEGKTIQEHEIFDNRFSISPKNLSAGLYILSIEGPEGFYQTKLRRF